MPERDAGRAGGPASASSSARRSSRSSARWTAERWIPRRSASSARVASGVSRRASATSRTTYGCSRAGRRRRASAIASSCRPGGADRALEVGRLGVEDAVELAAQGPRDLARLELEQRAARPDPAQERPDRLAALPGHDATAAAEAPRRRQAEVREAGREHRRLVGCDDELEVGPAAGQAERAAGEEPAAQPGGAAVVGGAVAQSKDGAAAVRLRRAAAAGWRAGPRTPRGRRRRARDRRPRRRDRSPRRVDGGQLGAQGRDEVALGAGHVRRSGPAVRRRSAGASVSPSNARMTRRPAGPGRGGGRSPGRRRRRGPAAGRAATPAASAGGPPSARRSRPASGAPADWLLASTMSTSVGRRVRDQRLDVVGEVEAGRLALLGRDVADEDPRRAGGQHGVADGRDQQARQQARVQAARAEDDELGLGDRGERVLGRADVRRASARRDRCPACA